MNFKSKLKSKEVHFHNFVQIQAIFLLICNKCIENLKLRISIKVDKNKNVQFLDSTRSPSSSQTSLSLSFLDIQSQYQLGCGILYVTSKIAH